MLNKILIQILSSNPIKGGFVAIVTALIILGLMILVACIYGLF
jgi:hypothetical protein